MRIRKIHVYLTVVLMVLGFMTAYSVQFTRHLTAKQATDSQLEKKEQIQQKILDEQTQIHKLESELQGVKQEVSGYEKKMGTREDEGKDVLKELEKVRMEVGLVPVTGKGIVVTLNDSKDVPDKANVNDYIVHEENIRQVVNELFASGAEAISINGQRLTTISSIRCVGPTVLVNEVKTAPPFEISAIGNSQTMMNALEMAGGVVQNLKMISNIEIKVEPKDKIDLPAYAGDSQNSAMIGTNPANRKDS